MKTPILALSAAAILLAASTAHAIPSDLERYTHRADATAQTLLRATGLDFKTQPVSVRATVDFDGRLNGIKVVRSSGSPGADLAVETVLRKVLAANPLRGMTDGAVTLNAGGAPVGQAKAS